MIDLFFRKDVAIRALKIASIVGIILAGINHGDHILLGEMSKTNWIKGGYADFIIPQFYRYKLGDYQKIIDQIENQLEPKEKEKVFAGVLNALACG